MGLLVDGEWQHEWYDTKSTGGCFERQEQAFRSRITPDGMAGPSGEGGYRAATDRYLLCVGHFKCNLCRLIDYPNLWAYTREIFQHPKIRPTVNFEHIKKH